MCAGTPHSSDFIDVEVKGEALKMDKNHCKDTVEGSDAQLPVHQATAHTAGPQDASKGVQCQLPTNANQDML